MLLDVRPHDRRVTMPERATHAAPHASVAQLVVCRAVDARDILDAIIALGHALGDRVAHALRVFEVRVVHEALRALLVAVVGDPLNEVDAELADGRAATPALPRVRLQLFAGAALEGVSVLLRRLLQVHVDYCTVHTEHVLYCTVCSCRTRTVRCTVQYE